MGGVTRTKSPSSNSTPASDICTPSIGWHEQKNLRFKCAVVHLRPLERSRFCTALALAPAPAAPTPNPFPPVLCHGGEGFVVAAAAAVGSVAMSARQRTSPRITPASTSSVSNGTFECSCRHQNNTRQHTWNTRSSEHDKEPASSRGRA